MSPGACCEFAKPLYPYRGPLITSGIEDLRDGPFRAERGAFRVDIGNEGWNFVVAGGAAGADPDVTTIDFVNGVNRSGANPDGNTGAGMFGKDLTAKLNEIITRQFRVGFLIEQTPDPDNRVTLSEFTDGLGLPRPKIAYSLSPYAKRGIAAAKQLQALLFRKMGAKDNTTEPDAADPTRFVEQINGPSHELWAPVHRDHRMGFSAQDWWWIHFNARTITTTCTGRQRHVPTGTPRSDPDPRAPGVADSRTIAKRV
jgi:hypothetical protein